jgi:hypothetical protein
MNRENRRARFDRVDSGDFGHVKYFCKILFVKFFCRVANRAPPPRRPAGRGAPLIDSAWTRTRHLAGFDDLQDECPLPQGDA